MLSRHMLFEHQQLILYSKTSLLNLSIHVGHINKRLNCETVHALKTAMLWELFKDKTKSHFMYSFL
jgi:hypothetical protein